MAVSRKLHERGFVNVNDEVTIFGLTNLTELFSLLIERGIFSDLPEKAFSTNAACLESVKQVQFSVVPLRVRFVGHFFTSNDADDLIEFFYHLKNCGLTFEIVDSEISQYAGKCGYYVDCIKSNIKLLGYFIDLAKDDILIFSNEEINRRSLIQWARQLDVEYSIESPIDIMRMIDELNRHYLIDPQKELSVATSSHEPLKQLSSERMKEGAVHYQKITPTAQFNYCMHFIARTYHQIGGGVHQALLEALVQNLSQDLDVNIDSTLMSLEGLLAKNTLFGLFQSNFPSNIKALNDDLVKNTCAHMLGWLMKACTSRMKEGAIKDSLLMLMDPVNLSAPLMAKYEVFASHLAALRIAIEAELQLEAHAENHLAV